MDKKNVKFGAAAAPQTSAAATTTNDGGEAFRNLVQNVSDSQSIKFQNEITSLLMKLPLQVNVDALASYKPVPIRPHQHPAEASTTLSPRRASEDKQAKESPRGKQIDYFASGMVIPLPSNVSPRDPSKVDSLRTFYKTEPPTDEELEAQARRLRIPRKPLVAIYQERVSPRQDVTEYIFSHPNSHLRSGYTSIETRPTRKQMGPLPPAINVFSTTSANRIAAAGELQSGSPSSSVPARKVVIDVSPIESPRQTFTSKIRETILHTGKPVQTADPRRIPTLQQRFESSYGVLYTAEPVFDPRRQSPIRRKVQGEQ